MRESKFDCFTRKKNKILRAKAYKRENIVLSYYYGVSGTVVSENRACGDLSGYILKFVGIFSQLNCMHDLNLGALL